MQVERLTVQFFTECEKKSEWGGNSPILTPLVGLIRQGASSLRTLNLRGIPFDELFDVRICNGARGDPEVFQPLLVRTCTHTINLHLDVTPWFIHRCGSIPSLPASMHLWPHLCRHACTKTTQCLCRAYCALCACTELRGLYVSRKEGDGCHMRHSRLVLRLAKAI